MINFVGNAIFAAEISKQYSAEDKENEGSEMNRNHDATVDDPAHSIHGEL